MSILISLSFLLASCAAQDETHNSAQDGLELWSAMNEAYPQGSGLPGDYYGMDGYGEQAASIPISLAFNVPDMNGDKAADLLVLNISTDLQSQYPQL